MAPSPQDESARLDALRRYEVLDTEPEASYDDIAALAAYICDTPIALVSLVDEDRQWFKAVVGLGVRQTPREYSFCTHAILLGGLFVVPDARSDRRFAASPLVTDDPKIRFYAGATLTTPEGHALGTLCVIDRRPRELSAAQRGALEALGRQVSSQLELRRQTAELRRCVAEREELQGRLAEQLERARTLNAELEAGQRALAEANARLAALATIDGLTGIRNRCSFEEALASALSFAERRRLPLSVVLLDVDRFKAYNDAFGHPAGDEVLRRVGAILNGALREHDVVARYGGEEFALLLPATDAEDARLVAERVRAAIEADGWPRRPVTASLGVATASPPSLDPDTLINQADLALYRSKRRGRNRVTHHHDPVAEPAEAALSAS